MYKLSQDRANPSIWATKNWAFQGPSHLSIGRSIRSAESLSTEMDRCSIRMIIRAYEE